MPDWRRTLYTIWVTQFLAVAGYSFVTPFLPYYIQDLGIQDTGAVALWAGFCTSSVAVGLALMAPVWGVLSDRFGRKSMVLRATIAGTIIMGLMGLVVSVQQLVLLRFLQGVFTGTITASTTLVASIAPDEQRGAALGSLQTAMFLGTTLGPLLGGLAGDSFGYRQSFWVTATLLFLSALGVTLFVHEVFEPVHDTPDRPRGGRSRALAFLLSSGSVLAVILLVRVVLRAGTVVTSPVLALFVQSLLPAGAHAAIVTGLASGASALGGAIGAPVVGAWGDKWGHRRLLIASGVACAVCYVPQAFAPSAGWLALWQLLTGFAVGGTLATGTALLAQHTARGREGMVFGLDASGSGIATAAGPMLGASSAAMLSLRAPFLVSALVMAAGVLIVMLWVHEVPAVTAPGSEPGAVITSAGTGQSA